MKTGNAWLLAGWLLLVGCSPKTYTRIPANGAYNFFSYQPDQTAKRGPAKISAHRGGETCPATLRTASSHSRI